MFETVVSVDGMMCGMCESHVNDAIRNAFSVVKVTSSHKSKKTVILSKEKLDEEQVRAAIDATGYTVTAIETREAEEKKSFFRKLFG
ncbi:MAG: heavy-metal-associated domain-containing protein [Lachnospiraceae bacterium]|nr:heavy-metal-associated domain-containing protein [Lachnospiraceae bacterium]